MKGKGIIYMEGIFDFLLYLLGFFVIVLFIYDVKASNNKNPKRAEQSQVENNDSMRFVETNEAVQVNRNNSAPRPEKNQQNLPQVQKNEGSKVCRFCGHQYEPGETFCPDCGAVETEIKM